MKMKTPLAAALLAALAFGCAAQNLNQPYSAKIREYTTEPFFLTELVDHLPASDRVPAPDQVLGYVVGTPEKLTYSKEVYAYFRALAKATPRVQVLSMGKTEEGREMILALISDEANLARLPRLREITARLADPRQLAEPEARKLINEGLPFYWATGAMHSSETGSPEMLMEFAYRLAVSDTPLIQQIRKNTVVMITPVLEVDGRDRYVDTYRYRKANPDKPPMPAVYWGHYVQHDNNRDAMALSLAMSRHMMRTFLEYHPQVLHDLHESIPFLYTSTGMGPYNAWLDPIVINEWQSLAYHEVGEMTKRGVPGVWTQGFYDGWAPNYMFYVANGHNSIGRFYETFGGRGADTLEREVPADYATRTWFRPNPPLTKVKWSIRNNINLQQSALLLAINKVANEKERFLENFYLKGKRSIAKPANEGPAAWVLPGDDPRPGQAAELVRLLQMQGVEVHRLDQPFELVEKPAAKPAAGPADEKKAEEPKEKKTTFPAGSYIIRMDQPYSRMADLLLDKQYYDPKDTRPYDDTGWSLGPLRNVRTVRVLDQALLRSQMTLLTAAPKPAGGVQGDGPVLAIHHNHDNTLATFRFRLRDVEMLAAEAPFEAAGRKFAAGSFLIRGSRDRVAQAAAELGLTAYALPELPKVATHPLRAPRLALVHTWQTTQNEGWVRLALESLQIPYEYISDQVIGRTGDLRAKYDVILFGPAYGASQRVVNGIPKRGAPIPWKASELTPNIATSPDQTDDIRGGMGLDGIRNIQRFVEAGGVFMTIGPNASIPIDYGLIDSVSIQQPRELQARGSVFNAVVSDPASPIAYGYPDKFAVYFSQAPVFQVSRTGGYGWRYGDDERPPRPSGRGSKDEPDVPQGRPFTPPEKKAEPKPGEEPEIPAEYLDEVRHFLPAGQEKPRIVLRFAEEKDLLVSGMLAGGRELANRPAVVDVPLGKGHFVLFANNPMWRQQTQGSFFLVFNTLLNWDSLGAGAPK